MFQKVAVEEYLLLACLSGGKRISNVSAENRYMKINERQVQCACQVAEWLGLATPSEDSALGWAPTAMLVDHLLQREMFWDQGVRRKAPAPYENKVVRTIFESAIKYFDAIDDCAEYVQRFLGFLGLMKCTDDGEWFPTRRLIDLAANCQQRDSDAKAAG
jgi:hypothetical protein